MQWKNEKVFGKKNEIGVSSRQGNFEEKKERNNHIALRLVILPYITDN